MPIKKYNPNRDTYKCLSGSMLKLIALVTMIIDHIGSVLLRHIPSATAALFTIRSHEFSLYVISRLIGRLAFPIYCFLLVEGFIHTRDRKKYGINLLLFALISEIPWNFEHTGKLTYVYQNVFFTLFLGYFGLCLYEKFFDDKRKQALSLVLIFIAAYFFKADYGIYGYCLIILLYVLRENNAVRAIAGSCLLSPPYMILPTFLIMEMYSGKRGFIKGRVMKYAFYASYPVHILILYFIRLKYIGYE